jgi:nicotinate-nucleotide adenylyltransferase
VRRVGRRIGVLGGTFDPVHIAHLMAGEEAAAALALDQVLFVPARTPPHKIGVPMSDGEARLAMLALALADNARFATSRVDLDRPGPDYTVDMLTIVRSGLGLAADDTLWFILGADSLADLPTWHDPIGIIAHTRLAVVGRPDHTPDLAALEARVPGLSARVDLVPMPLVGVSGTDIRRRVAEGHPIRYQVPDAIEQYIRAHGLYLRPAGVEPITTAGGESVDPS